MSYITRNLTSTITVWGQGSLDIYGNAAFSTPVAIKGRWEDRNDLFRDNTNNELVSKAVVYVDTDVSVGSFVYLGTSTASSPPPNSWEVKAFRKIPNLSGTESERKCYL